MSKVYVFMADGTEEVEALTVVDLLRRAGVRVTTVSVMKKQGITGSHQIMIAADELYGVSDYADGDMLVLPGGMPGTLHLKQHEALGRTLQRYAESGKYLAAICAAPSVLGYYGFLNGKKAVCYPGFEEELTGAQTVNAPVVRDGQYITSRGLGTAIDFALELIAVLCGEKAAQDVAAAIQYR